ncbi:MAG: endopeptidase La [Chloroflexi bacterium]|nr:endopeptidase La [Chloroflexota bacterium]
MNEEAFVLEPLGSFHVPDELAILPGRDVVVFPLMVMPLIVVGEPWVRLVEEAVADERIVGVFAQMRPDEAPSLANLNDVGCAVRIARMAKLPERGIQVYLQGLARIRLTNVTATEPYPQGAVEVLSDRAEPSAELEALRRSLLSGFRRIVELAPSLPKETGPTAESILEPGRLADFIASVLSLLTADRQELLETLDVTERLRKLVNFVGREAEILEIAARIQSQMREQVERTQREYYLREQMKVIQRELGDVDQQANEVEEIRGKIEAAGMSAEAHKEAERELERMARTPAQSPDRAVTRAYLDWLVSLPWSQGTEDTLDIPQASAVLDEDHYDLERIKDRILEYLAVRKLKHDLRGPILCFAGPPGVGKTSLGQSIARSLGRKFVKMSLGGMRDEAEIRGHRRTYIGAMPGRIIQAIRRSGSNNPVFMLDEVDKMSISFQGDPAAALLEVLDPAQNFAFVDHYLNVPFDLSRVMFITTANILDPVPPALRDRMEVLTLSGYTDEEKLEISKRYLVSRQLQENALTAEQLTITDEAVRSIIGGYTWESGVRNLEREIATICRKVARKVAEDFHGTAVVSAANLPQYLGPRRFRHEVVEEADEVGVATGLSVTPVGGEVLFVEASAVPGRGGLTLTGLLGDVMQESARAALTYARSRADVLGLPENFYQQYDIHVHVPAGAIPKDGPSAGITLAISLISALTQRPINKKVGMTGEITLRGKILPVGGIKEKALAAHRAGAKTMILPRENEKDLEDIPGTVKKHLKFVFVQHMDEVLALALRKRKVEEKAKLAAAS